MSPLMTNEARRVVLLLFLPPAPIVETPRHTQSTEPSFEAISKG